MRFAIFTLMTIFFTACATQNTRDSMRGIELNSTLGTELGELYGLIYMYTLQNVCGDKDYEACENLLQSACDDGGFKYCTILGIIYSSGLNKSLDESEREAKASALFKRRVMAKTEAVALL